MVALSTTGAIMTKVFNIAINGYSQEYGTLDQVRAYLQTMVAEHRAKAGDKYTLYQGTVTERGTSMYTIGNSITQAIA